MAALMGGGGGGWQPQQASLVAQATSVKYDYGTPPQGPDQSGAQQQGGKQPPANFAAGVIKQRMGMDPNKMELEVSCVRMG